MTDLVLLIGGFYFPFAEWIIGVYMVVNRIILLNFWSNEA